MRIVNAIFPVLLVVFAAVQVNDPDGLFWAVIYALGAAWCALAALRPALLAGALPRALYGVSLLAAVGGLVYFWSQTPCWWHSAVWWETETAREGISMMILVLALVLAGTVALRLRKV